MAAMQSGIDKDIRANNDEFERNIRAQNAAALVESFYTEDAVTKAPDMPMVTGKSNIKELWQGLFKMGLKEVALETVKLEASGDLASEVGKYTLKLQPEGAPSPMKIQGGYVVVHRRQPDGSWKASIDTFSHDAPIG